jgi:coenzyme PQQ precursor peptide PqqA
MRAQQPVGAFDDTSMTMISAYCEGLINWLKRKENASVAASPIEIPPQRLRSEQAVRAGHKCQPPDRNALALESGLISLRRLSAVRTASQRRCRCRSGWDSGRWRQPDKDALRRPIVADFVQKRNRFACERNIGRQARSASVRDQIFRTCAIPGVVLGSASARSSRQISWENGMTWKAPKIVEVSVGMEINMYACAARK